MQATNAVGADSGGTSSKTETLDCGFALRVLPEAMDPRMSRILVASVCEVRASTLPKTSRSWVYCSRIIPTVNAASFSSRLSCDGSSPL